MNDVDNQRKRPCTGCFACSMVCPSGAIAAVPDENGFYKPIIDADLCKDCGLCRKVCYSHLDIIPANDELKAYYGWHKDADILKDSASGGITTAIAAAFIEMGYSVIGCAYNASEKKAEHIWIDRKEDIRKLRGSKYFQSDLTACVERLKKANRRSKLVVFGTPCQIMGLKTAMKKLQFDFTSVYFVELFCHGVVSPGVWQSYVSSNPAAQNADGIRFRTKKYGWHISCNEFVKDSVRIPTKRVGDGFFQAFYSKDFFNRSCYDCDARKNIGNADLRIGDFWGKRFVENKTGVSCIISSGERGEYVLDQCREKFELYDAELSEVLASQSYDQTYPFDEERWNRGYELVRTEAFSKAVSFINSKYPLAQRMKNRLYIVASNLKHSLLDE